MKKIPSLTKKQMDLLTEIQEGYEKRIRNQRDSIDRLLADREQLRVALDDERKAREIAGAAADRFRDLLWEALDLDDQPGDDEMISQFRLRHGLSGPESTRWRDFLAGAVAHLEANGARWQTDVVLAESEELKGEEMSNEQLPDETADPKEPVTGEHDRDFGEADPKETHVQATEVVEEDEDTELSDDQSTKLDSQ